LSTASAPSTLGDHARQQDLGLRDHGSAGSLSRRAAVFIASRIAASPDPGVSTTEADGSVSTRLSQRSHRPARNSHSPAASLTHLSEVEKETDQVPHIVHASFITYLAFRFFP